MSPFEKQVNTWTIRRRKMGDGAVGRKGEDYHKQAERTAAWLTKWLPDESYYEHGLDFGCGWGRFTEFLAAHCGHLWAVDVFQDWVDRAAKAINVTPVCLAGAKLPATTGSIGLIVDLQTLQSLDDALLITYSKELQRIAEPGATVISMHVVKPEPIRSPEQRARLLGLKEGYEVVETTDIDDAKELYTFLVGTRA